MPTRAECLELLERIAVPGHIRRHSEAVARVAARLGRALGARGVTLDLELIECAALLHDIGKARAIETHAADHAELGADMLEELGLPALAPIVRAHAGLASFEAGDALTESLVVNYADKRVMHEAVVSLEVRFADLAARYAHDDASRANLERQHERYRRLEAAIFEGLSWGPEDIR